MHVSINLLPGDIVMLINLIMYPEVIIRVHKIKIITVDSIERDEINE